MLFILVFAFITVIILGIGIAYYISDDWHIDGMGFRATGIIMLIILAIMIFTARQCDVYKDVKYETYMQRYNSLVYQLENNFYDKFTYDGRENLMKNILNYNNDVLVGRAKKNSLWIGCWYKVDYDSLPLIEY